MRRAFTLAEIIATIAILMIVGAISYPVFSNARRSANRTFCISNFKQLGVAMLLYRENQQGSEQGKPSQMGLPPDLGHLFEGKPTSVFQCKGNNPKGNFYSMNWPEPQDPEPQQDLWARYSAFVGPSAILIYDENHQPSFPRSLRWEHWTVLGLRIDGSVTVRTNLGFPISRQWWHD